MKLLPNWCLTDHTPGFYDTESGTAIEQTARVYKAMNDLIAEYNTFVDSWNKRIEEFTSGVISDNEEFRIGLRQEFQDFINVVELTIENINQYVKNELKSSIEDIYSEITSSDDVQQIITANLENMKNTINAISTSVETLNNNLNRITDYVVEEGEKEGWKYRKWASGIAECWGVNTIKFNTAMADNGNYAVTGEMITVTLPDNLFNQSPVVSLTPMGGGYSDINIGNIYSTHFTVNFRSEWAVTDMPNWVQCICYGRWK